jgi:hypothetical protein
VPFLAVTHLHAARCPQCGSLLAAPGARSFIVAEDGLPASFSESDLPNEIAVELQCPHGHALRLLIPNQAAAEDVAAIPDEAPIGSDARLIRGEPEPGTGL